ncbi:hypothetical protein, partial [Pseudomonas sp. MD332_8]
MGFPCDEILRNHSKGMSGRFYTLWARSGHLKKDGFWLSISTVGCKDRSAVKQHCVLNTKA